MTTILTKRRRMLLAAAAAAFSIPPSYAAPAPKPAPAPFYKQAVVYTTAQGTDQRIKAGAKLGFDTWIQPQEWAAMIMVDPTQKFQTVVGFGGGLTDASAETLYKMAPDKQKEILKAYFSPTEGIGYTLGRTNINSCDFSSDTYSYDDTPGDVKLTKFSLAHDLKYKIPFIKAAKAMSGGQLQVFGTPWSPPAWMKTNNDMSNGGGLRPEYRQAWADYYVRFINEYKKLGIPIWGLTVQNEEMAVQSWESCVYTAPEEQEFVRDYLGPTLEKNGMSGVRLMVWDHNRGLMYQRVQDMLADPKTAKYIWGTAYHWYVGDHFDIPGVVHDAFPNKAVLFTEGSLNFNDPAQYTDWTIGERYGENVMADLNHWSAGWVDWNVLLDQRGGPNHQNNFCCAPIMADIQTGEIHYLPSYYYLGHFSKFIRPGARRVACTSTEDGLQSTAFLNPDKSLAVVVLNLTGREWEYRVWIDKRAVVTRSPAHSIETMVIKP
ncbi:MAG: glycosyl hydrolase [Capsulimonas sp.]|nr:glycosyl hydrolase [Capsulimonas sp.]